MKGLKIIAHNEAGFHTYVLRDEETLSIVTDDGAPEITFKFYRGIRRRVLPTLVVLPKGLTPDEDMRSEE